MAHMYLMRLDPCLWKVSHYTRLCTHGRNYQSLHHLAKGVLIQWNETEWTGMEWNGKMDIMMRLTALICTLMTVHVKFHWGQLHCEPPQGCFTYIDTSIQIVVYKYWLIQVAKWMLTKTINNGCESVTLYREDSAVCDGEGGDEMCHNNRPLSFLWYTIVGRGILGMKTSCYLVTGQ